MNKLQNTHIVTVDCGSDYGRMKFWFDGAVRQAQALNDENGEGVFCVLAENEGKAYFYKSWAFVNFEDFVADAISTFNAERSDGLAVERIEQNVLVVQ